MKAILLVISLSIFSLTQVACKQEVAVHESPDRRVATQPSRPSQAQEKSPIESIREIAINSSCAQYSFKEQGKPAKPFLKGVALSYARALCRMDHHSVKFMSRPIGLPNKDALAHYAKELSSFKLSTSTEVERLRHLFALIVGSAARESSWRWCLGKDPGASNTTAETCEAGLYQTSYNSRSADPELNLLYAEFKGSFVGCFASDYKGSITCSASNMKNWGSGEGVAFQKLTKDCPGFATEYHAVMLRAQRTHYGPINTRKSELRPECSKMFQEIEKLITPEACKALGS